MAIHSDNDHLVPLQNSEILRDKLGAKLFIMKNTGHLNEGNGFFELPIALEEILKMSSQ